MGRSYGTSLGLAAAIPQMVQFCCLHAFAAESRQAKVLRYLIVQPEKSKADASRFCASTSPAGGPCTKSPKPTLPPSKRESHCEIRPLPLDNLFAVSSALLTAPDSLRRHPLSFSRPYLLLAYLRTDSATLHRTLAQLHSSEHHRGR